MRAYNTYIGRYTRRSSPLSRACQDSTMHYATRLDTGIRRNFLKLRFFSNFTHFERATRTWHNLPLTRSQLIHWNFSAKTTLEIDLPFVIDVICVAYRLFLRRHSFILPRENSNADYDTKCARHKSRRVDLFFRDLYAEE